MDVKAFFVEQLKQVFSEQIGAAGRAESAAGEAADQVRAESRRREDTKEAVQQGRLEAGHRRRRKRSVAEMERLLEFAEGGLPRFAPGDRVGLGALVDVRIEDEQGTEERTLFFLPSGAGVELNGPGGDGFVVVVTPRSPVGRALMRARPGDSVEVVVEGRDREWTVLEVG